MAFSLGRLILLRMMYMNWATVLGVRKEKKEGGEEGGEGGDKVVTKHNGNPPSYYMYS